jgi:hypothetical protein
LSTNRNLIDKDRQRKIPTGIYYNHPAADKTLECLNDIDGYLKFIILSNKTRIGRIIVGSLNNLQKRKLLKISFTNGFEKRIYKKYTLNRLKDISKIWK